MFTIPKIRKIDSYGSGNYKDSRRRNGKRYDHTGVDLCCDPDQKIFSNVSGKVTKLGFPYSKHLNYRYVEVTDRNGYRHRYFYVMPTVSINDFIGVGDELGTSQSLSPIYPVNDARPIAIIEHVHYEVMKMENNKKVFFDPRKFLGEIKNEI